MATYAESGDVCESGADEVDLTGAALAIFGDDILPDVGDPDLPGNDDGWAGGTGRVWQNTDAAACFSAWSPRRMRQA